MKITDLKIHGVDEAYQAELAKAAPLAVSGATGAEFWAEVDARVEAELAAKKPEIAARPGSVAD